MRSPETETNYTLISAQFGWRLSRSKSSDGEPIVEWRCPACWRDYKRARGSIDEPKSARVTQRPLRMESPRRSSLPRPRESARPRTPSRPADRATVRPPTPSVGVRHSAFPTPDQALPSRLPPPPRMPPRGTR